MGEIIGAVVLLLSFIWAISGLFPKESPLIDPEDCPTCRYNLGIQAHNNHLAKCIGPKPNPRVESEHPLYSLCKNASWNRERVKNAASNGG